MRIKELLTEATDFTNVLNTQYFKEIIAPFLDNYSDVLGSGESFYDEDGNVNQNLWDSNFFYKNNSLLFHGTGKDLVSGKEYPLLSRGEPRDTPVIIHDLMNQYSEEKFNVPIRSLLFTTNSMHLTSDYSPNILGIYIIVPVGQYEMFYSTEYDDMYADYLHEGYLIREKKSDIYNLIPTIVEQEKANIKNLSELEEIDPSDILEFLIDASVQIEHYPQTNISELVKSKDSLKEIENNKVDSVVFSCTQKFKEIFENRNKDVSDKGMDIVEDIFSNAVEKVIKLSIEGIKKISRKYVSTVKSTTNPSDVPFGHEIMLECDKFIPIRVDTIIRLYNQYKESK